MAQINIRVEDELKKSVEETLDTIGLSMSTAIHVFLKKVAREKRIPFELSADPFYSNENMARLEKAVEDAKSGRNMAEHELLEVDE